MVPTDRAVVLAALGLLAGCAATGGVGGGTEEQQVQRLLSQGFTVVADGRGTEAPTALRYSGPPGQTIQCRQGFGGFSPMQAQETAQGAGWSANQRGGVDAWVVVDNDGNADGLYVYHVDRSVAAASGVVAGREFEKMEFSPGSTGRFESGTSCRANL